LVYDLELKSPGASYILTGAIVIFDFPDHTLVIGHRHFALVRPFCTSTGASSLLHQY